MLKKLNKKGFTLVELLAVIVILGVIMLIAIPSVGTIINNSKKNSFVSTGKMYISTAQNLIAGEIDSTTSYCIPVTYINDGVAGKDVSPIDSTKNIYGYVLATYNTTNKSYDYTAFISDGTNSASYITASSDKNAMDTSFVSYSTECGTGTTASKKPTDTATENITYTVMK